MSQAGKFSKAASSKSSPGRRSVGSLGIISEDNSFDDFADADFQDGPKIFTKEELFDNDLSMVDSVSTPGAASVYIDLEAEERAFVTGSQQYLDAVETIKQLKQRLIRRTAIIDEIRKYYLRDVVTVKHIMKDVLTKYEREEVLAMYEQNLPSINLNEALRLHAPVKSELQVSPCGECGGHLEIVMKDSDEVDKLKKLIVDIKDRESRFRIKLATLDAQIEATTREKAEAAKSHAEEKRFLYAEMKKVKAQVEKVQSEMSAVNKVNKRCQEENEAFRAQLNALQHASTQLAQGTLEIESLRSEVSDLTSALKSARLSDKTAQRELADKVLELTNVSLRVEEQSEMIKTLRGEKETLATEISTLKQAQQEAAAKATESAELVKAQEERIAQLEGQLAEATEEQDRLAALMDSTDGDLRQELLNAEDECSELRAVNKRQARDLEGVKRQLEKAQEQRLVLEHDLAVMKHENVQREEELLSLQNFIQAKATRSGSFSSTEGEPPLKIEEVLRTIQAEVRSKVGEGPSMSAKVASLKLQQGQNEDQDQGVEVDESRDDEDNEYGNFDQQDDEQTETDATETRATTPKKKKPRKAKTVIVAASTMAKGVKARRGSFGDKTGLKEVLSAATAAAGSSGSNSPTKAAAPRSKTPKKATRQRTTRRSFDFAAGVPPVDSGDQEAAAEDEGHGSDHDTQGQDETDTDVASAARAAASATVTATATGGRKDKSPKKSAKRVKRKSFDGGVPRPTTPAAAEASEGHASDHDEQDVDAEHQEDGDQEDDVGEGDEDAVGEEGEDGTEDGAGDSAARNTPTKKKRATTKTGGAGKPTKAVKKPSKARDASASSAEGTPASTPLKAKRSTASVKAAAAKVEKGDGKKDKAVTPERGRAKRRKSFGGGEGQDSRPSSRPTTRGSEGEDSRRASADNEDDGEAEEVAAAAVAAVKKGRSNRPLKQDNDASELAQEGQEVDEDDRAEEGQRDDDNEEGEGAEVEGDGGGAEEQTEGGEASEAGSKPSTARRGAPSAKVTRPGKSIKQPVVSRKASTRSNTAESFNTDAEGEGDRPSSRESIRSRNVSPSKKATTSRDIKREAMEKERSARASLRQQSVKAVAPSLDRAQKDRRAKPPLPKRNDGSRRSLSRSKPGSAGSDLGSGGLEAQEDDEHGLETGDNTASNTEFNSENNSDGEENYEDGEVEGEGAEEHSWEGQEDEEAGDMGEEGEGEELEGVQEEEEGSEEREEAPQKHQTPTKQSKQANRAVKAAKEPKPKPVDSDAVGFDATPPEPGSMPQVHLPLPRRRRSLPKNYSFSASSLADLLRTASNDSMGSVGRSASPTKTATTAGSTPHAASPAPALVTTTTVTTATGAAAASPMPAERKAKLQEEFAAGLHRVPDPPSIQDDDDLRDRSHVKYVPIIPIEVKRYVSADPAQPSVKKKFTLPTEEKIELEPLAEDHTPFEAQLRKDLLRVLTAYKGMTPNEMNRAMNAAKPVLHALCKTYADTLDTTWSALKAGRAALDLHYVMKNIVEGMAPCMDAKSGTVELAEAVKKLLPIAGLNMTGPAVTAKWQEEVQLHTAVISSLLPQVDPATGKIACKAVGDFFNPSPLDPNNRPATAFAVLQEKAQVAERAAHQMQNYAIECAKSITEKITPILKDWAKAKNVVYELDAKIFAEKEKVRKALEVRIADLTKDKLLLNSTLKKADERIKALEYTEQGLEACKLDLKKSQGEVQNKLEEIEGLEAIIKDLNDEVYERKKREADFRDEVSSLVGQRAALEREKEALNQAVAQGVSDLRANKEVLKDVTEERDHFQAQYERMLMLEDRRLNKLNTVAMQCEPMVQDLAIQTEFVAPPMNLRTMVAAKNARGKKASIVMSQSLEIAPSDPGALTSLMVDTASSTFHPMSPAGTVRVGHGTGSIAPGSAADTTMSVPGLGSLQYGSPPSSQHGTLRSLPQLGGLSDRSSLSVETGGALGTARMGSRGPTSAGMQRGLSREDSFFNMSAADYLAAAPINYELSSHRLAGTDTLNEIARSLAGDDGSVGSSRSIISKVTKKKAIKVNRGPQQSVGSNLGHYQYVHTEDKIPEWGAVHGPVGGSRVDPHVVLGISGVNSIGGHASKAYGQKGELAGSTASGTLAAAGSALLRGTGGNSSTLAPPPQQQQQQSHGRSVGKGLEIDVGLPGVKVQSYQSHSQKASHGTGGGQYARQQAPYSVSDAQYLHSGPNSRGSHANSTSGLGPTSSADALQLMLDSPSITGHGPAGHSGFDFERDRRKQIARIAADLPPGQELVNGIVYNHRGGGGATYTSSVVTDTSTGEGAGLLHSASQGSVATHSLAGRGGKQVPPPGGITGISEDMLKRLRKELLSR